MGCGDEKLQFFKANPELKEFTRFFAKTSIEREIQVAADERQQKFATFSKLIELGEEVYGGIKDISLLEEKVNRDYENLKKYFESMEDKIPEGAELYFVYIVMPTESKENFGYLALKNGKIVFDDTSNLMTDSKIDLQKR